MGARQRMRGRAAGTCRRLLDCSLLHAAGAVLPVTHLIGDVVDVGAALAGADGVDKGDLAVGQARGWRRSAHPFTQRACAPPAAPLPAAAHVDSSLHTISLPLPPCFLPRPGSTHLVELPLGGGDAHLPAVRDALVDAGDAAVLGAQVQLSILLQPGWAGRRRQVGFQWCGIPRWQDSAVAVKRHLLRGAETRAVHRQAQLHLLPSWRTWKVLHLRRVPLRYTCRRWGELAACSFSGGSSHRASLPPRLLQHPRSRALRRAASRSLPP